MLSFRASTPGSDGRWCPFRGGEGWRGAGAGGEGRRGAGVGGEGRRGRGLLRYIAKVGDKVGGAVIMNTFRISGSVVYTNLATSNLSLATSVKVACIQKNAKKI